MFNRVLSKIKEIKERKEETAPIEKEPGELPFKNRERKEEHGKKNKEIPKTVKVVAVPRVEEYPPTVFFALTINEKLDEDWRNWTEQQVIKTTDIRFEYVMDYAFKLGNNHIVLINNVENLDEGWQCELYIDDKLVGKGKVTHTSPLKVDVVFTNNAMVPRKSFRNGWTRTKMVRGLQLNKRMKGQLINRIKVNLRSGSK